MNKLSQKQWVINQFETKGFVTRNEALKNYISRLGALIFDLKEEGWQIEGHWERTLFSKDYVYTKVNRSFRTAQEANDFIRGLNVSV